MNHRNTQQTRCEATLEDLSNNTNFVGGGRRGRSHTFFVIQFLILILLFTYVSPYPNRQRTSKPSEFKTIFMLEMSIRQPKIDPVAVNPVAATPE